MLPTLAWFGVLHGLSEWLTLFARYYVGLEYAVVAAWMVTVITAASFVALMQFGLGLEVCYGRLPVRARIVPWMLAGLWTGAVVVFLLALGGSEGGRPLSSPVAGAVLFDVLSRYVLALPAAVIAGLALVRSARFSATLRQNRMADRLHILGGAFLLYGIVAGLTEQVQATTTERMKRFRERKLLEEERERLGRDLHDRVVQSLFAAGLELERVAESSCMDEQSEDLRNVAATIKSSILEIRSFITSAPTAPQTMGEFAEYLADHCHVLESTFGARVILVTDVAEEAAASALVPGPDELLGIVSEAVANAYRHGEARLLRVQLSADAERTLLSVVDNGAGFPPEGITAGQGLPSMHRRAARAGGTLTITPTAPRGISVQVEISAANRSAVARKPR
ncbi:MAG: hypothetical protein GVY23_06440 [Spirochaetes bacterium]|jgi:signal transduction histidine kinase|nr:hypothetical protein [Spirochaetota bacterium]